MQRALAVLTSVLAVLGVAAATAAIPAGRALLWPLERTLHAGRYRPATLTVAWAAYRPPAEGRAEDYWAVGTIEGRRERLGLAGTIAGVHGWDELEAQIRPGQQIRVLYDPSLARTPAGARVIGYEDHFAARERTRLARTAALVYGPSLLLLGASLAAGSAVRRPPVRAAVITVLLLAATLVVLRGSAAGGEGAASRAAWHARLRALLAFSVIAAAGTAGAIAWHALRERKQRTRSLRRRAAAIGFEFLGDATDVAAETDAMGPFPLVGRARRPRYENRMRGVADGYDVLVLDFADDDANGRSRSRTVARLGSLSLRLPVFTLAPREAMVESGPAAEGETAVALAGYTLRAPDPAAAAAFPPATAAFLDAHRGWNVESLGDRLLVYRGAETIPAARLDAFLADALALARVLHGGP